MCYLTLTSPLLIIINWSLPGCLPSESFGIKAFTVFVRHREIPQKFEKFQKFRIVVAYILCILQPHQSIFVCVCVAKENYAGTLLVFISPWPVSSCVLNCYSLHTSKVPEVPNLEIM